MTPQDGSGKIAVVTGGARGIGAAITSRLTEAGVRVALLDREVSDAMPAHAYFASCDVADEASVEAAFADVDRVLGPVDILVNAAGLTVRAKALDMRGVDFAHVVGVNLTGAFLCCREAARRMAPRNGGTIVNIASIMGFSGGLFPNPAYQASKGGLVNLTRALAVEWAPLGIRVNAVAPTYVETALTRDLLADPRALGRVLDATPLRRLAAADEVASAVLFLAGTASSMTTGHTLPVDGGFLPCEARCAGGPAAFDARSADGFRGTGLRLNHVMRPARSSSPQDPKTPISVRTLSPSNRWFGLTCNAAMGTP